MVRKRGAGVHRRRMAWQMRDLRASDSRTLRRRCSPPRSAAPARTAAGAGGRGADEPAPAPGRRREAPGAPATPTWPAARCSGRAHGAPCTCRNLTGNPSREPAARRRPQALRDSPVGAEDGDAPRSIRRRWATSPRGAQRRPASTSTWCPGRPRTWCLRRARPTGGGLRPELDISEYGPKGPGGTTSSRSAASGPDGRMQARRRRRMGRGDQDAQARAHRSLRVDGGHAASLGDLAAARADRAGAVPRLHRAVRDGGQAVPDPVPPRCDGVRAEMMRDESPPHRHLRHGDGLAGRAAQGGRPRRARLRRARLPADVDAARGAGDPGVRGVSAREPRLGARARRGRQRLPQGPRRGAGGASARGIPLDSFPSLFAKLFLPGKRSVVVAGTHGKTTTSSLLAHVLARRRARSLVPDRRRAAELPAVLAPRRRRRVRRRGGRVRHRLLRQGLEVPPLPAATSRCSPRSSSTTPTSSATRRR